MAMPRSPCGPNAGARTTPDELRPPRGCMALDALADEIAEHGAGEHVDRPVRIVIDARETDERRKRVRRWGDAGHIAPLGGDDRHRAPCLRRVPGGERMVAGGERGAIPGRSSLALVRPLAVGQDLEQAVRA